MAKQNNNETLEHDYEEGYRHGQAGEAWHKFAPMLKNMGAKRADAFSQGFLDGRLEAMRKGK